MYHLGHTRIASIKMLQELHPEGHASAAVIFVKKDGVRDAAGIGHPAEGIQKFTHLSRTEFKWATPARISFSAQSGKMSRACSASLT